MEDRRSEDRWRGEITARVAALEKDMEAASSAIQDGRTSTAEFRVTLVTMQRDINALRTGIEEAAKLMAQGREEQTAELKGVIAAQKWAQDNALSRRFSWKLAFFAGCCAILAGVIPSLMALAITGKL